MQEIFSLFAVFLAIFIFGMTAMRIGLYNLSQKKLKDVLLRFTSNPFKGLLVGTVITALLQSSSAVMVITIGLVAAGYLTFKHSIGIILGANIGTTFTAEFITIDIYQSILPLLFIGAILLLTRYQLSFNIGAICFGIACLFLAMDGFEGLAEPLATIPFIHRWLEITNGSGLAGIGIGTLLTAVIQSSTATTGIVMGFINGHLLSLPAGTAIIMGANIGTCITAFLASIGARHEAKLVAYAHIWLNVIGVILFFPFIQILSNIALLLTQSPDLQLAHVSLLFNIISSLLALPLTGLLSAFILRVHGQKTT